MKTFPIKTLFTTGLFAVSISITAQAANNDLATYQQQAKGLLEKLEAKSEGIEAASAQLVSTSLPIVNQFIAKYPECTEYLTALKQAADKIPALPLAEIESGYHADGKLPELKNAQCYHAKDLLVHPATVQAMAKLGIQTDEQWESAEHEIEEVIEHFTQVEAAMK
ncbi:hypothetical protein [Bacterioplanoides sp. SCSIO 12839]|uniref:hypothetical protein n=1 Tax=Bacterioplanoides sp. SCSIO 12839 TaxID=2829569 RepID=UPI002106BC99|nr:hypothetical protein [Bacterioplanoides sp. SCSIO 12839]UTW46932.1 hypothetical protein KFF03_10005 [Bacterioplanoides sp. SCSIO 12839]